MLKGWVGTVTAGALLAIVAAILVWLGLTGQLADLHHANLPFHPYPPAGYTVNPFDPENKDDLISTAEAGKVRADLITDGSAELQALATGDAGPLSGSTTGNFLAKLQQRLDEDQAAGIYEREDNRLDSVIVGRLTDPATVGIEWCVEERGTGTSSEVSRATGKVLKTSSFRSTSKFWLVRVEDKYLVTDAQITAAPNP